MESVLAMIGKIKVVKVNEIFISQGMICRNVYYVKKGIVRCFYITDDAEEKTIMFKKESDFFGTPEGLFENKATMQFWQALEDCELYEISHSLIEEMSQDNVPLMKKRLEIVQKMTLLAVKRVESFVLYSPLQRYQNLMDLQPEIIQRVADKHIASFIGVTPVSLSRIRKRLAENL
jgi:CRP-like cAMP-binding protein